MTDNFEPIRLSVVLETPEQAQALWLYLNTSEVIIAEESQGYETSSLELPHTSIIDSMWEQIDKSLEDQDRIPRRVPRHFNFTRKECRRAQVD